MSLIVCRIVSFLIHYLENINYDIEIFKVELLHLSGQQVKSFIYLNRNYVTRKKVIPEGV